MIFLTLILRSRRRRRLEGEGEEKYAKTGFLVLRDGLFEASSG
jgi:hypothetical protein